MSLNDGGPVVRVSKEPVEKPEIVRGQMFGPSQLDDDGLMIGACATYSVRMGGRWVVTYHGAKVVGQASDDAECACWILDVAPDTVVTWDRL
jgi:hypothetical protein